MMAEAISHFGKLHYTYLVVGWMPSDEFEQASQEAKTDFK